MTLDQFEQLIKDTDLPSQMARVPKGRVVTIETKRRPAEDGFDVFACAGEEYFTLPNGKATSTLAFARVRTVQQAKALTAWCWDGRKWFLLFEALRSIGRPAPMTQERYRERVMRNPWYEVRIANATCAQRPTDKGLYTLIECYTNQPMGVGDIEQILTLGWLAYCAQNGKEFPESRGPASCPDILAMKQTPKERSASELRRRRLAKMRA